MLDAASLKHTFAAAVQEMRERGRPQPLQPLQPPQLPHPAVPLGAPEISPTLAPFSR